MNSFAPPSTHGAKGPLGWRRIIEAAVLSLLLGLSFFSAPGRPDTRLDASWQQMLILAHAQGLQFGREIIFTWGPWGFLCSRFHLGGLEAAHMLAWQTLGQLAIGVSLVILTLGLPRWRRFLFVLAILAFHWLFLDSVYFVLITLIGISGFLALEAGTFQLVLWSLSLGFLSQLKFTYGVVSGAAVGCALLCWLARGRPGKAAVIGLTFLISVLGSWAAAGQNLDNLYPYVRRSLEISAGYGEAMGFDESWVVFLCGVALAAACALFCWNVWRKMPDRSGAPFAAGFLAFVFFVMWKESYTRADMVPLGGHIFGIFVLAMILAPALPAILFPQLRWHPFDAVLPASLLAIAWFDSDYFRLGPRVAYERLYGNVQSISHFGSLVERWKADYEDACKAADLPAIRSAVGNGTADVYDFNLGAAILGRLRISARPIFQSYSAYTPSLQGYNLRYFQSARAPDFLLWDSERVDNRFPGLDDAPLVAGLAGRYESLFPEGQYWLFRRKSPLTREPLERRTLIARTVRLAEEVELPVPVDHALWLEADPKPTFLGRVRSMAYKEAMLSISTLDDKGRRSVWRLTPRTSRAGFVLVPTLLSGSDVAAFTHGEMRSSVRSFHFETPSGQEEFWSRVEVRISSLPALPLRLAPGLQWLAELGIFDGPPLDVTSTAVQEVIDLPEGRALLLHADGEAMLSVPSGATRFDFAYGIRDGAYTGAGHTDGVGFTLDGVWPSGRRERLWERYLDPVERAADRGTLRAGVSLPAEPPARLILHTGPGPKNDNRWDWSYIMALRFSSQNGGVR